MEISRGLRRRNEQEQQQQQRLAEEEERADRRSLIDSVENETKCRHDDDGTVDQVYDDEEDDETWERQQIQKAVSSKVGSSNTDMKYRSFVKCLLAVLE